MLFHLFEFIERQYAPPGFQVFQFITVRAALAALTAVFIALIIGRGIIGWLSKKQIGESVREGEEAGAVDHAHKAGTPTMGGVIILMAILGATLLWGDLREIYVWIVVGATAWMGAFGFADDYIKVIKKDKQGLAPRVKIIGQVTLGLIVGVVLYFHPKFEAFRGLTYVPFIKGEVFDYFFWSEWVGGVDLGWIVYIPVVVFIITATSNAANLTDGLDGLLTGVTAFIALGLVALVYIAGNAILADYFNEPFLRGAGEMTVFAAAMAAACFGFLWYNGYPATVFMGDTGSLALGAAVATTMLAVRKELLLPSLCLIYFAETVSVIIQTSYFKYTKRKYGEGRRVFRMAPLHHHYEAADMHEAKIAVRFWIVTAFTVIATLMVLRIR
jgi:phospho-N-acetylmuramoyl-pentapeptide-transferase